MAGDEFGDHFALEGSDVSEHLSGITEVANGIDALHVRFTALVHLDEATLVHGDTRGFEAR